MASASGTNKRDAIELSDDDEPPSAPKASKTLLNPEAASFQPEQTRWMPQPLRRRGLITAPPDDSTLHVVGAFGIAPVGTVAHESVTLSIPNPQSFTKKEFKEMTDDIEKKHPPLFLSGSEEDRAFCTRQVAHQMAEARAACEKVREAMVFPTNELVTAPPVAQPAALHLTHGDWYFLRGEDHPVQIISSQVSEAGRFKVWTGRSGDVPSEASPARFVRSAMDVGAPCGCDLLKGGCMCGRGVASATDWELEVAKRYVDERAKHFCDLFEGDGCLERTSAIYDARDKKATTTEEDEEVHPYATHGDDAADDGSDFMWLSSKMFHEAKAKGQGKKRNRDGAQETDAAREAKLHATEARQAAGKAGMNAAASSSGAHE